MKISTSSSPFRPPRRRRSSLWLAMVGKGRIDETIDPKLTIDHAVDFTKLIDAVLEEDDKLEE